MTDGDKRPWFGPKRVGYGIRPQRWQSWALVLALAAILIVAVILHAH